MAVFPGPPPSARSTRLPYLHTVRAHFFSLDCAFDFAMRANPHLRQHQGDLFAHLRLVQGQFQFLDPFLPHAQLFRFRQHGPAWPACRLRRNRRQRCPQGGLAQLMEARLADAEFVTHFQHALLSRHRRQDRLEAFLLLRRAVELVDVLRSLGKPSTHDRSSVNQTAPLGHCPRSSPMITHLLEPGPLLTLPARTAFRLAARPLSTPGPLADVAGASCRHAAAGSVPALPGPWFAGPRGPTSAAASIPAATARIRAASSPRRSEATVRGCYCGVRRPTR